MRKYNNLTGQRFGQLTVIEKSNRKVGTNGNQFWTCRCDCGRLLVVRSDNLTLSHSTQCSDCSPSGVVISVFSEGGDKNGTL